MQKITLLAAALLCATTTLSAQSSGMEIYETNCKGCHILQPMMDKEKMMQMRMQERMAMKEKMMKNMKAPPMSKVSAKLKYDFKEDQQQVVAFIKDYIVNPSAEKAHCMPMALKRFGVMPAIGKSLSAEDLDTIARWVVDNFDEKWDEKAMHAECDSGKNHGMKCGQGKCGAGMMQKSPKQVNTGMKCAAGKCGGR